MDPDRLTVGGKDAELDERLDAELTAYNLATSGVHEQAEFTVKIEDDAGDLGSMVIAGEPHAQPQTGPPRGPAMRGKGDSESLEALHGRTSALVRMPRLRRRTARGAVAADAAGRVRP